jgi:phosphoribosylglycinamide formyltransferase 1
MRRIAILLSGRGSNFAAIHDAVRVGKIAAQIVAVISNRPGVQGIVRAREWGYETFELDHKSYPGRVEHEAAILRILHDKRADLVALAGYMRLLTPEFVQSLPNRIVNIHPSLLPAFPGVNAQAQAVAYGAKVSGCTVHLVDESLDGGPVLVQRAVPVREGDDAESLAARILEQEHLAYVEALQMLCSRDYRVEGRRVLFETVIPEPRASGATK